ncbi:MAG: TetR/AcrR family transcriptional regulator [Syntrophobacteraceae bacterium]
MPSSLIPNGPTLDNIDWTLVEKFHPEGLAEEQRTKYRIFFAAARLFAHKGYNGTAVREIVENASVTKPTLYYYFSNKEDLYVQLIDMAMSTFAQLLSETLAHRGSTRERIINLFSETLELCECNVDMIRLVNLMVYAPRGAVPAYDLKPKMELLRSALRDMLLASDEEESPIPEGGLDTALLLLLGLFRSIQIHLLVPEVGPPLTLDQIIGGVDLILEATRARGHRGGDALPARRV